MKNLRLLVHTFIYVHTLAIVVQQYSTDIVLQSSNFRAVLHTCSHHVEYVPPSMTAVGFSSLYVKKRDRFVLLSSFRVVRGAPPSARLNLWCPVQ